jgi:hypothetical protein
MIAIGDFCVAALVFFLSALAAVVGSVGLGMIALVMSGVVAL